MNKKTASDRFGLIGVVLFVPLVAGGCAGYSVRTQKILDQARAAADVSELQRLPLEPGQKLKHQITTDSEALEFDTGKSYAALFGLPEFQEGSTLEVKSFCDCLGLTKNVFIPVAALFDDQFEKTGEIKFQTHSETLTEPVHFVAEVSLEEGDAYLLVYSDPKRYGKPADRVDANTTSVSRERADYIREGMVKETYSSRKMAVWWKGHAVGTIQARVKPPAADQGKP